MQDAYMAALSGLFVYIMQSAQLNDFEQQILNKVYHTLHILYQQDNGYVRQYVDGMLSDSELAVSPYNEQLNIQGYKSLSQALLTIAYLKVHRQAIDEDEVEMLMQRVCIEYIHDRV